MVQRISSLFFLLLLIAVSIGQANGGCRVDFRYSNEWSTGFTAQVKLINIGEPWSGWQASWSMPDGQRVSHLWNGSYSQSGDAVTVGNVGWNGNVASGGSVSFGFNGSRDGPNGVPYDVSVNGELCEGQSPPPPPDPIACTVDYQIRNDWGNGATIDLFIDNSGRDLYDWSVSWTLPENQSIAALWSGQLSTNGDTATVTPKSWNRELVSGGRLQLGFNVAYVGLHETPFDVSVDGVLCEGQAPPPAPEPIACTVDYQVREDWGNGATIDVTLNNSGRDLYDWTVTWSLLADQRITGLWNAHLNTDGDAVTVTSYSWNRTLLQGENLEFGFNLAHSGVNPPPIDLALDGVRCEGLPDSVQLPPETPEGLTLTLVDNSYAALAWQAVEGDPQTLELQRRADGGSWSSLVDLPGDATAYADEGMSAGVAYRWRLRARNAAGSSGYSGEVSATLRDFSDIAVQALADNCVVCHGPDGLSGSDPMPIIAGFERDYFIETLNAYVNGGRNANMMDRVVPGYDAQQIEALATHFSALPFTPQPQQTDPALVAFGEQLHQDTCAFCHGDGGADTSIAGVPLRGQWRGYLETTLLDMAEGRSSGLSPTMISIVQQLYQSYGEEGISALAHYYAADEDDGAGDNGGGDGGDNGGGDDGSGDDGDAALPPAAPSDLTSAILATGSVELSWRDASNNELGFVVDRLEANTWSTLATLPAGSQIFQDSGVQFGLSYDYRLTAFNDAGSSEPVSLSVTVPSLTDLGASHYDSNGCDSCHGNDGSGGFSQVPVNLYSAADLDTLIALIESTMPIDDPGSCTGLCAESSARYLVEVLSADGGDGDGDGDGDALSCADSEPALPRSLRLLTRREYENTVNDLLGLNLALVDRLPIENRIDGYDNNAEHNRITSSHQEIYLDLALELADRAMSESRDALLPCEPTDADCAETLVRSFGQRAFRRTLSSAEVALWVEPFAEQGFDDAMGTLIAGMLISPHFLYRSELGVEDGDGHYALDNYELASALSYLFHGTLPDAELMAAADAGELTSSTGRLAQARRLLESPATQERLGHFAGQWLLTRDLYEVPSKDANLFPDFNAEIGADMAEELKHFFNYVSFESSGRYEELLLANFTMVNRDLANYYGLSSAASGESFVHTPVNDGSRLGVLTLGSIMSGYANSDASHPFKRGAFFLDRILCQELPPQGNMGVQVPQPDPTLTTRERFDIHSNSDAVCSSCHQYIDGPGFSFEHWDGAGRFRISENGLPIDGSGVLRGLTNFAADEEYPFQDLAEMRQIVAGSDTAPLCLAEQYYQFATGHGENESACSLEALKQSYADNGYDIPTLLLAIVGTRDFTHRHGD